VGSQKKVIVGYKLTILVRGKGGDPETLKALGVKFEMDVAGLWNPWVIDGMVVQQLENQGIDQGR